MYAESSTFAAQMLRTSAEPIKWYGTPIGLDEWPPRATESSMTTWTKKTAVQHLKAHIAQIKPLAGRHSFSSEHTRWVTNVLRLLEQVFGRNSRYYLTFSQFTWRFRGTTLLMSYEFRDQHPDEIIRNRHQTAYIEELECSHGLLSAALDEVNGASDIAQVYEGKDTPPEASSILKVINMADRKLRKVIHHSPTNEKQVQDAFENLLVGSDISYSREKVSIEYSTRSYRPDFTIDTIDLAIEIKLCKTKDREGEIVKEINDDILAYKTRYGNILFVVYDLGCIRDVARFAGEFEKHENVVVRVIKQ